MTILINFYVSSNLCLLVEYPLVVEIIVVVVVVLLIIIIIMFIPFVYQFKSLQMFVC